MEEEEEFQEFEEFEEEHIEEEDIDPNDTEEDPTDFGREQFIINFKEEHDDHENIIEHDSNIIEHVDQDLRPETMVQVEVDLYGKKRWKKSNPGESFGII